MEIKLLVGHDVMKRFDIVSQLKKLKLNYEVIESKHEHELMVVVDSVESLFNLSNYLIEASRDLGDFESLVGLEIYTSRSGNRVARLYTRYEC